MNNINIIYLWFLVGGFRAVKDFDKLKGLVSADAPCYLLFNLSSPSGWLIITYIPETVKVSDKMVYAATKSRLKTELGNHKFVDEMHANEPVPHAPHALLRIPLCIPHSPAGLVGAE